MADNFRESSLRWVGRKFFRRAWETVEYRFSQIDWPELPELPQWEPPQWLMGLFEFLAQLGRWLSEYWLFLTIGAVFAGLFFLGWWLIQRYGDRPTDAHGNAQLPEDASLISGSVASWLAQAQDYRRAQRYKEACRSLYFAMLLKLDEAEIVPQRPSRTDREYLYLTQDLPQPEAPQLLIETHERLCFSRFAASEELFQHCLNAFDKIERQVEVLLQARTAAAQAQTTSGEVSQ